MSYLSKIKLSVNKTATNNELEFKMEREQLSKLAMSVVELLGVIQALNERYSETSDILEDFAKKAADVAVPRELEDMKTEMIKSWREAVSKMRDARVAL